MKSNKSESGWSTAHEMVFIGDLGTYTPEGQALSRPEIMQRYRIAIEKRVEWGDMNAENIKAVAKAIK